MTKKHTRLGYTAENMSGLRVTTASGFEKAALME